MGGKMDNGMRRKKWQWGVLTACLVWLVLGTACQAQEDRLSRIEKELAEIKRDVAAVRQMLTNALQGQAPAEREVSIDDAPIRGNPKAKLTLVEFSDFQCPFCGRFFHQTLPQIEKEYIQTGKLRLVMRELPLTAIHPFAQKAAEAAECAGVQGKYWEMHDKLFQNQKALEVPHLKQYAKQIGLNSSVFDECLDRGAQVPKIQRDIQEARSLGVNGTPGFFLGLTTPGKTIKGVGIEGAQPIEVFRQEINRLLGQAAQPGSPP
jgi:protein-disulfide isomerase